MPKSVAYIGLSGPVCYDYKNRLNRKYPNPILEGPLGLMILYDEVVFLHEALCPKSMRKLDFVKFLSDRKDIIDYLERIEQKRLDDYARKIWQGNIFRLEKLENIAKTIAPFARYDIHSNRISEYRYDNHSNLISQALFPNSISVLNVIYDNIVAHDEKLTLVTNSLVDGPLATRMKSALRGNLINNLLTKRIPNYLTENGPYTKTIYDIRNRPFLKKFRNKIYDVIQGRDTNSVNELTQQLETELNEIGKELVTEKINPKRIYYTFASIAMAIAPAIAISPEIAKAIALLGMGIGAFEYTKAVLDVWSDRTNYAWTGFLVDLERKPPVTRKTQ
jgi:hypothetical protein